MIAFCTLFCTSVPYLERRGGYVSTSRPRQRGNEASIGLRLRASGSGGGFGVRGSGARCYASHLEGVDALPQGLQLGF
eukprot:5321449-Prymnesium_polylepis.1